MKNRSLKATALILAVLSVLFAFSACNTNGGPQKTESESVSAAADTAAPATETEAQTEAEPLPLVLEKLTLNVSFYNKPQIFNVGSDLELNESGLISGVKKSSSEYEITYNDDFSISKLQIVGTDGGEEWEYVDGKLSSGIYDLKNGFRSRQEKIYSVETDDLGRVTKLTLDITFTDPSDGSVTQGSTRYDFFYGEDGRISSIDYYAKGSKDHTVHLTYDEAGNLLVYSCVGSTGGEYLRVELTYTESDGTVIPADVDNFTNVYNLQSILEHLI